VGLPLENVHFRSGNSLHQHSRLRNVIASDSIRFADQHQCWRFYIPEAMGAFEIVPGDAKINKLRELRVGRPGKPKKFLDFGAMLFAIIFGEKGVGFDDLVINKFLESHFDQVDDHPMRQAWNTIRAGPRRGPRSARGHDQALHTTGKILRQRKRDAPAHRVADQMRAGYFEMIHQRNDIERHLLDRIYALHCY
jgi:hypothetical protein